MKITFHRADDIECQDEIMAAARILSEIPGTEELRKAMLRFDIPSQEEIEKLQARVNSKLVQFELDAETGDRSVILTPEGMKQLFKAYNGFLRFGVDFAHAVIPMLRLLKLSSESLKNILKRVVEAFEPQRDSRLNQYVPVRFGTDFATEDNPNPSGHSWKECEIVAINGANYWVVVRVNDEFVRACQDGQLYYAHTAPLRSTVQEAMKDWPTE